MRNSTRSWILLSFISLSLVGAGYMLGGREGLLWGFAFALILNTLVYFYGDLIIARGFKGQLIEGHDPYGLTVILAKLCRQSKMPQPKIYLVRSDSFFSFSIGRNWANSCIYLSDGAAEHLNPEELEAILAYELASIYTLNSLANTIVSGLISGIFFVPAQIDRALSWALGKKWSFQRSGQMFIWITVPLSLIVLKLCIGANTKKDQDLFASNWLKSKDSLASTLWKLESYARTKPHPVSATQAHLLIINPLTRKGWARYFIDKVSTEARIRNLVGHYPI